MRMNFFDILKNEKTVGHEKYQRNQYPSWNTNTHKTSAQLPSPVKAKINISRNGRVEKR